MPAIGFPNLQKKKTPFGKHGTELSRCDPKKKIVTQGESQAAILFPPTCEEGNRLGGHGSASWAGCQYFNLVTTPVSIQYVYETRVWRKKPIRIVKFICSQAKYLHCSDAWMLGRYERTMRRPVLEKEQIFFFPKSSLLIQYSYYTKHDLHLQKVKRADWVSKLAFCFLRSNLNLKGLGQLSLLHTP